MAGQNGRVKLSFGLEKSCASLLGKNLKDVLIFSSKIDDATKIKNTEIAKELSLPPVKLHCSSKWFSHASRPLSWLWECRTRLFYRSKNFLCFLLQFGCMGLYRVAEFDFCINVLCPFPYTVLSCANEPSVAFFTVLAEDAIKAALKDYKVKQQKTSTN